MSICIIFRLGFFDSVGTVFSSRGEDKPFNIILDEATSVFKDQAPELPEPSHRAVSEVENIVETCCKENKHLRSITLHGAPPRDDLRLTYKS